MLESGTGRAGSTGSTKRVTAAAVSRPAIEYTPSCARPGKLEKSSAAKPQTDVATPKRMVSQYSRRQLALLPDCTR